MKSRYFSKPTQANFIEMHKLTKQIEKGEEYYHQYHTGEFTITLRVIRCL